MLETIEGEHDTDYVNASYVDVSSFTYVLKNTFIYKFNTTFCFLNVINPTFLEFTKTKRVYSHTRTHRRNSNGLLEDGVARKGELYNYVNEDIRFH